MFEDVSFVDLTHMLEPGVPSWTGRCGFKFENRLDYADGVRAQKYEMHAGIGTHMDSPSHYIPGGMNIGDIDVEQCIGHLRVIDVKGDVGYMMGMDVVREYERQWGVIEKGEIVVMRSGWERFFASSEKYRAVDGDGRMQFPGMQSDVGEYLAERGVKGIGVDTLSPDGNEQEIFPVHRAVLGSGAFILENLCNLGKMPERGAWILALPPKVGEGTEVTTRVVGAIQKR